MNPHDLSRLTAHQPERFTLRECAILVAIGAVLAVIGWLALVAIFVL